MDKFNNLENPGIVILSDGKIYDTNKEFIKSIGNFKREFKLKRITIFDILEDKNHTKLHNISEITNGI